MEIDQRRLRFFAGRLHRLLAGVSGDVDSHRQQISEVSRELAVVQEDDTGALTDSVLRSLARIMAINERLQGRLESAEQRLRQQNEQLEAHFNESRTDALTGLMNRRAFDDALAFQAEHGTRPFAVMMLDVDHFKAMNDEHSGQTYRLKYGATYIKIDLNYLSRVALLEPRRMVCPISMPPVEYMVLDRRELLAGKVRALMGRVASRDLYDLARAGEKTPHLLDDPLARALVVRAISAADSFPAKRDPRDALSRFTEPDDELVESLHTVLAADDQPSFPDMCERVADLLAPCALLSEDEAEYFRLLDEEATYRPELLLSLWPDVLERAKLDPVIQWKVQNLRKRAKVV